MEDKKRIGKGTLTIVWILLMALTTVAFFASEDWFSGRNLAILLMIFAAIKFIGVSFWFMEMKTAHPAWKWTIILFLLVFSGLIVFTA